MTRFYRCSILPAFAALLLIGSLTACAQETPKLEGAWSGTLEGMQLRIVFHLEKGTDGTYTATMDSPDQGATGIPVQNVVVKGRSIRLEMPNIRGTYEGELAEDGSEIPGVWKQGGMEFKLTLKPGEAEARNRPQNPTEPYPYNVEEVTFRNEDADITLAGTLTIPKSEGPHTAAVLISGSGGQNRDEELFGHRPFLVLADYLTRHGIAVLRFDDRGVGESEGSQTATSEDFATDAAAAVRYLQGRREIDRDDIGLIGHSEGGIIAPMVANRNEGVAFIVMLAGPAMSDEEILKRQQELIARASGVDEQMIEFGRKQQERYFRIVRSDLDSAAAYAELLRTSRELLADLTPEQRIAYGAADTSDADLGERLAPLLSTWFRFFIRYDPAPALKKLDVPLLALFGEKDLQVPAEENAELLRRLLKEGEPKKYQVKVLPGLNHLFQPAETGSPNEYGHIETTIDPHVMKVIAEWIEGREN